MDEWHTKGDEWLRSKLQQLDNAYFHKVDPMNMKRIFHAIEISITAGKPYSELCTGSKVQRPFEIEKIAISMPRSELFERINRRVDAMISAGLENEARNVFHLRQLNSLNTVGLKEMFAYFDGIMDKTTAIERIKKNTRVYAKKQMTWFQRDKSIHWIETSNTQLDTLF
jgi:tRNA dimethylallyltransferase